MRFRRSLRAQLLAWLLIPLCFIALYNAWSEYDNARVTASLITDRLLLASARVLAEQVHDDDGHVEAVIQPAALGLFASVGRDRVFYNIQVGGRLIAGDPDVPLPREAVPGSDAFFYSGVFRAQPVRAVALEQPLATKAQTASARVIVGVTLREEGRIVTQLWMLDSLQQAALVACAAALAWFGLGRGLAPLIALRDHVRERDLGSIGDFPSGRVPTEMEPVVSALNEAMAQFRGRSSAQRRFLTDAAHQLRTPLAILKTQASVGLRGGAIEEKDEALKAIDASADTMTRLANQLLALARSEPDGAAMNRAELDLAEIARGVLEVRAPHALDREIDLGFEGEPTHILGDRHSLVDLCGNLVDNALLYTPSGGAVTVRVRPAGPAATLSVEDSGPGIPVGERGKVFERFYRVPGVTQTGSGIGLTIVQEIARSHGAEITLSEPSSACGLLVTVSFRGASPP